MTPSTDRAARVVLWALAIYLWVPIFAGIATGITLVLFMLTGTK